MVEPQNIKKKHFFQSTLSISQGPRILEIFTINKKVKSELSHDYLDPLLHSFRPFRCCPFLLFSFEMVPDLQFIVHIRVKIRPMRSTGRPQAGLFLNSWGGEKTELHRSSVEMKEFHPCETKTQKGCSHCGPCVPVQGSAVAVAVQGDEGRRYNDGQWHSITATRRGAVGTIVVDNQYRG